MGPSWSHLGWILSQLGAILGHLGLSWASWGRLGPSRGHLEAVLGPAGGLLGPSWGQLGASWGHLGDVQVTERKTTSRRSACFYLCRRALGQGKYLEACWGFLGAILGLSWASLGPSWRCPVARTTQEPIRNARGATRETPSSTTANGIKALPCHILLTASVIHTTSLSVPLPGRFAFHIH